MSESSNPHDPYLKVILSRAEARRVIVESIFDPKARAALDFRDVRLEPGSFVDAELRAHHSDVLLSLPRIDGAGEGSSKGEGDRAWVYVLVEHKSRPDRYVAVQLLRYVVRIHERWRNDGKPIHPVVPVVVYAGQQAWNAPERLSGLFEPLPGMRDMGAELRYALVDLRLEPEERFSASVVLRAGMTLLRHARSDEALPRFREALRWLKTQPKRDRDFILASIQYLVSVIEDQYEQDAYSIVEREFPGPEDQEMVRTVADAIFERGLEQGLEQGLERGLEQGLERGLEQGRAEGRQEGINEGRAEGQQRLVLQLAHDGVIGGDQARDQLTRLHQDGTITHAQLAQALAELGDIDRPGSDA